MKVKELGDAGGEGGGSKHHGGAGDVREGRTNYTCVLCVKCICNFMAEQVYTGVCSSEVYKRLSSARQSNYRYVQCSYIAN